MEYLISTIADVLNVPVAGNPSFVITEVATDSRKIFFPATTLFFALPGVHNTGELFINDLVKKGVKSFVVSGSYAGESDSKTVFLKVPDVLKAMQHFAGWHRTQFALPVIGITGSNGKTIVKELLFQLLYHNYNIVRSPKSYNSQLGVPLSVCEIKPENTLGIFEAGISKKGEMEVLKQIIKPGIGIFTFAGAAHAQGFENLQEKIREKLKLFQQSEILFYCADELLLSETVQEFVKHENTALKLFSWSKKKAADIEVLEVKITGTKTKISCRYLNANFEFTIPFTDEASIHNCVMSCCVLLHLGFEATTIDEKMQQLRPVEMRLELKKAINNCSLINDSYNSDINSINIALHFLMQQQQHTRRSLILSDVFESGDTPGQFYEKIAAMVSQLDLYRFIGVGKQLKNHASLFSQISNAVFYESTDDLLKDLSRLQLQNETILLKGARVFQFEKISHALELQTHQTVLEINLDAMRHNLQAYRAELQPGVKLMAMVKAFSYGTGSFEVANVLQHAGVDYLAVAYADEGIALREAGIRLPIMVLNIDESAFSNVIEFNLEPELFSLEIFELFGQYLQQQNITAYPVHLKLDTGMHRLGFTEEDMPELLNNLQHETHCKVVSVFSHLAASDDANEKAFTEKQRILFVSMSALIHEVLGYDFIKHISNTAGISGNTDLQMDMVRLGIGLYGVDANPSMQEKLQVVNTLRSTIAQIKNVKKGETVGYGRKNFLQRDSTIAVVRIGYADGYRRILGNGKGKMSINGQLAPIIGNVCMDMTMLDVTGLSVKVDDEVIVYGPGLTVQELSKWAETIPYEIFTDISQRVQRIYYQD